MAKVTYASLKLKTNTDVKTLDFNGNIIKVSQYLPIEDKYSLINITLQEAKENNIYNPVKLDSYFHLNILYSYTNISFTDKQREDEGKLYDALLSSGLLDKILELIPENEYSTLLGYLEDIMEANFKFDNSTVGMINNILTSIPQRAEEMNEIIGNFDTSKFQAVMDFVQSANGGRAIN